MKNELEQRLFKQYQQFFTNKDDKMQSLMSYGFEHGNGWFNIVETILEVAAGIQRRYDEVIKIRDRLQPNPPEWVAEYFKEKTSRPEMEVVQAKEKFGGLRFYYNSENMTELWPVVQYAASLSEKTCEICGNPGKLRTESHVLTLCDVCAAKI